MTNDKKIFLISTITAGVLTLVIGCISLYSILFVEKKAETHIKTAIKMTKNLKDPDDLYSEEYSKLNKVYQDAYFLVRTPQIFAAYKNFDPKANATKKIFKQFDEGIYKNKKFDKNTYIYINYLLDRRKKGSMLGLKTSIFLLIITLISAGMMLTNKKED